MRTIARVKYDVRGVEGSRSLLPAGVYNAKIASADVTKPEGKDQRIEVVFEIVGDKTHKGSKLYEYINLESESAAWKLREFLEAAQVVGNGGKESGTLDTEKLVGTVIGVKTFVRPADDARGFDESARVRRMFVADGVSANGKEEEDLDGDDDDAEDEYAAMSLAELKAELKERDLSTKGKKPALIARLEEDDEEEEEDEDEEDEDEEYAWSDIAELSKSELKELIEEQELDIAVKKKTDVDELRVEVAEALDIEVPDDEEGEDDEDEDDYDEWSQADLKTELEERSLSTKGGTKVLVSRLRKDDAEEDKPF